MTKIKIRKTAADGETGDYELLNGNEVITSWDGVTRREATSLAKEHIAEEIMGYSTPESKQVVKQLQIHMPFIDRS